MNFCLMFFSVAYRKCDGDQLRTVGFKIMRTKCYQHFVSFAFYFSVASHVLVMSPML